MGGARAPGAPPWLRPWYVVLKKSIFSLIHSFTKKLWAFLNCPFFGTPLFWHYFWGKQLVIFCRQGFDRWLLLKIRYKKKIIKDLKGLTLLDLCPEKRTVDYGGFYPCYHSNFVHPFVSIKQSAFLLLYYHRIDSVSQKFLFSTCIHES